MNFSSIKGYLAFFLVLLGGCAALPSDVLGERSGVIRGKEYVIHEAGVGDTWAGLAETYLQDKNKDWLIADFNKENEIVPGRQIVIPLIHPNPVGVFPTGYQTVTILCYHRFGPNKSKMEITGEDFNTQMNYLKKNGYRVIPLSSIPPFLRGESALPKRAVALTFDDGYRSSYDIAYPILKKYGFPATLFIYSDFIGSKDALTCPQMKEMINSGLVDIQPHSKTHISLTKQLPTEDEGDRLKRMDTEINAPAQQIQKMLGVSIHTFAYPFGDSNKLLISSLKSANYKAAVTVHSGGNPSFAYPFELKRTMIFGNGDMNTFISKLEVFKPQNLR